MSVTLEIPSVLRSYCDGACELSLRVRTVRAALQEIERSYPELYRSVCDETGAVRPHVNLFVNSALVGDKQRLDETLSAGDVVSIYQAVSGG